MHGTFDSRLTPRAGSPCSGAWAVDDYNTDRGEEGDRSGIPPLKWNRANGDDTEPSGAADEEAPSDNGTPSDTDEPTDDANEDTPPDDETSSDGDEPTGGADQDTPPDDVTSSDGDGPTGETPSDVTAT